VCFKKGEKVSDLLNLTNQFANKVDELIKSELKAESLSLIKKSHGNMMGSPECCKENSYIYFLYNDNKGIIYIGETGKSIKRRLFTDGSGAHCNKDWFVNVKKIEYYKNNEMKSNTRKIIERALIKKYNPKYNRE